VPGATPPAGSSSDVPPKYRARRAVESAFVAFALYGRVRRFCALEGDEEGRVLAVDKIVAERLVIDTLKRASHDANIAGAATAVEGLEEPGVPRGLEARQGAVHRAAPSPLRKRICRSRRQMPIAKRTRKSCVAAFFGS